LGVAVLGASLGIVGLFTAAEAREEAVEIKQAVRQATTERTCTASVVDVQCTLPKGRESDASVFTLLSVGSFVFSAAGGALVGYEIAHISPTGRGVTPRVTLRGAPGGAAVLLTGSF
jgi:hypothetical protein